jgi:hypothetical protein
MNEIYDYGDYYAFRVSGLLHSTFLIAGLIPPEGYTTNKYEVDLSDPKSPARAVDDNTWDSATSIPFLQRKGMFMNGFFTKTQPLVFHGFQFTKTGEFWAINENSRLSPDETWIVLQSWTGSSESGGETGFGSCFPWGCRGKVFLDVSNVISGKKLLTLEGTYSAGSPEDLLKGTGWLTERYFIVPLGTHRERCLVCDFGGRKGPKL